MADVRASERWESAATRKRDDRNFSFAVDFLSYPTGVGT
jgi:hypothetical protein